jgi:hypothetical protein
MYVIAGFKGPLKLKEKFSFVIPSDRWQVIKTKLSCKNMKDKRYQHPLKPNYGVGASYWGFLDKCLDSMKGCKLQFHDTKTNMEPGASGNHVVSKARCSRWINKCIMQYTFTINKIPLAGKDVSVTVR